jgi:hypothetical protein
VATLTNQTLDDAIDQAAQAITEGRDAVQGLRASVVESNDLAVAIRTFGEELAAEQSGEQHALEVPSIAGIEFDSQSCADAAGLDPERMDELCRTLADRHCILRRPPGDPIGSPDDGTTRYAFAHAMYREVLYRRQAPGRRARLHLKLHRPELAYPAAASQLRRPVLEHAGSD